MIPARPRTSLLTPVLALVVAVLGILVVPTPAEAAGARSAVERRAEDVITGLHDAARSDPARFGHGSAARQAPLTGWTDLRETAREWSDAMGQRRQLSHSSTWSSPCCARASGENVGSRTVATADAAGAAAAARDLFQAWMDSASHRANVMDGRYDELGVGARLVPDGSSYVLYVTVNFRDRDPAESPHGVVYHRPARAIGDTCDGSPDARYRDVPRSNVHRATIDCITAHGISEGDGAGGFGPGGRLNRAQLATFLARTLVAGGVALPSDPRDHFDDDDGLRHEHSLNVLAEVGVIDRSDRRVGPGVEVTREEMALWTAAALHHGGGLDPDRAVGDHFSDDDRSGAQHAINRIADAGIVTGAGDGTFGPRQLLRRDQMATFLARSLDLLLDT